MDNGPRQGLDKFLKAASDDPDTVLHYEFMQDYKVLCQKLFSKAIQTVPMMWFRNTALPVSVCFKNCEICEESSLLDLESSSSIYLWIYYHGILSIQVFLHHAGSP